MNPQTPGSDGIGMGWVLAAAFAAFAAIAFVRFQENQLQKFASTEAPATSEPAAEQAEAPASPASEGNPPENRTPEEVLAIMDQAEAITQAMWSAVDDAAPAETGAVDEAKVIGFAPSCAPPAEKLWYDAAYKVYRSELHIRYPADGEGRYPCLKSGVWHTFPSGDGHLKVIVLESRR